MSTNNTASKIRALQTAGEDFEWYPTTDEILAAFREDLYKQAKRFDDRSRKDMHDMFHNNTFENIVRIKSLLDVGAGDGRVFSAIKDLDSRHRFALGEKYGIEIARAQSDDLIRKGVFIIGRDFFQTALIDKQYSVIFSNPPYSIYEDWAIRLLKEASFGSMYLVLPVRWENSKDIAREIKRYDYESVGEYDFTHGDRAARARVNLIRITNKNTDEDEYRRSGDVTDAFRRWIHEHIGTFEGVSDEKIYSYEEDEKALKIKSDNDITELVEDYTYEMNSLIEGFRAIAKLPVRVIHSLDLNKESLLKIIGDNISALKKRYWRIAFNKLKPVTERLTRETRRKLLDGMDEFNTLDFNEDNVYSICIWIIENTNAFIKEQLVEMFNNLASIDYMKAYKSNTRWEKSSWRYAGKDGKGKPERYALDYRFVADARCRGTYSYGGYSIIEDLIIVLRSLGVSIPSGAGVTLPKYSPLVFKDEDDAICGKKQDVLFHNGDGFDTAFECRFYHNRNVHVKVRKEFMMRFNIEAGRILGWLNKPQDIADEFEVSESEAAQYWNNPALMMIGQKDLPMLEYKEAV
jgi:hypothetical protein